MTCPSCGSPGAYVGLAKVECDREGCEKWVAPAGVALADLDVRVPGAESFPIRVDLQSMLDRAHSDPNRTAPPSVRCDDDGAIYFDGKLVGRILKVVMGGETASQGRLTRR